MWAILEPVIRARVTYAVPREMSRQDGAKGQYRKLHFQSTHIRGMGVSRQLQPNFRTARNRPSRLPHRSALPPGMSKELKPV